MNDKVCQVIGARLALLAGFRANGLQSQDNIAQKARRPGRGLRRSIQVRERQNVGWSVRVAEFAVELVHQCIVAKNDAEFGTMRQTDRWRLDGAVIQSGSRRPLRDHIRLCQQFPPSRVLYDHRYRYAGTWRFFTHLDYQTGSSPKSPSDTGSGPILTMLTVAVLSQFIGLHDPRDEGMANDVGIGELDHRDLV